MIRRFLMIVMATCLLFGAVGCTSTGGNGGGTDWRDNVDAIGPIVTSAAEVMTVASCANKDTATVQKVNMVSTTLQSFLAQKTEIDVDELMPLVEEAFARAGVDITDPEVSVVVKAVLNIAIEYIEQRADELAGEFNSRDEAVATLCKCAVEGMVLGTERVLASRQ